MDYGVRTTEDTGMQRAIRTGWIVILLVLGLLPLTAAPAAARLVRQPLPTIRQPNTVTYDIDGRMEGGGLKVLFGGHGATTQESLLQEETIRLADGPGSLTTDTQI